LYVVLHELLGVLHEYGIWLIQEFVGLVYPALRGDVRGCRSRLGYFTGTAPDLISFLCHLFSS